MQDAGSNENAAIAGIIHHPATRIQQPVKMILYNVTVKINAPLEKDWLQWMKEVHIPDVLKTGLFSSHKICKILFEEEDGGVTYAVQYFCADLDAFNKYQAEHAPALQKEHTERYKDQYVAFRTLMEVIQ